MKYSQEIVDEICSYVSDGLSQKDAVDLAGVSEAIFYIWAKEKVELIEQLKKSKLQNKLWHIRNIKRQSNTVWTASAWYLSRVYSKEFAESAEAIKLIEEHEERLQAVEKTIR